MERDVLQTIVLETVDSTNGYVAEHVGELPSPCVVSAKCQTAGRGQRGNSWESQPGKNLTFTMLFRPERFPAIRQFRISQAVALAICETLEKECGVCCEVKWPNDIYASGKKICGILISHSLDGRNIAHTIVGAGVNINQERFLSDAPNPVSVFMLTGRKYGLDDLLDAMAERIRRRVETLFASAMCENSTDECESRLHSDYMARLWRGDGREYLFRDCATGREFNGVVSTIEPTGHIHIADVEASVERVYAFKEVEWLIKQALNEATANKLPEELSRD